MLLVDCFGESSLFAATSLGIHSLLQDFLHRGGHRNILSKNNGVGVVWFALHKNTVLPGGALLFSATVLTNVRGYTLPFSSMALAKLMWGKIRMPDVVSEDIPLHGTTRG